MNTDKAKKTHSSADAFLTNPVASANEFTGYGARLPLSDEEADSLSEMFEDVPCEESRMDNSAKDIKKNRNTVK